MLKTLRRFQQPIMLFVTVIVVVSFVWAWDPSMRNARHQDNTFASMLGRQFDQNDVHRASRTYNVATLVAPDLAQIMRRRPNPRNPFGGEPDFVEFFFDYTILKYEMDTLGIEVSSDEVLEAWKAIPSFQTIGQFDPSKYAKMMENLPSLGFSEADAEGVLRDGLRLKKLQAMIGGSAKPSADDIREQLTRRHESRETASTKLEIGEFIKAVTLTDDDLKKAFEERKATFNTPEKRKVKYAAFTLAKNTDKPLSQTERVQALQKFADQAAALAEAMTADGAKFDEQAKASGATTGETELEADIPSELFGQNEEVNAAAFALTKEQPNSDPITTDNGYYIIQLGDITAARPMTFDESKDRLKGNLTDERAREAMDLKIREHRAKIEQALKDGKTFADAVAALGLKAETHPAFSSSEPLRNIPGAGAIMSAARPLQQGELSQPAPDGQGVLLVYVTKVTPPDEAKLTSEKTSMETMLARRMSMGLFQGWLADRRLAANVQIRADEQSVADPIAE